MYEEFMVEKMMVGGVGEGIMLSLKVTKHITECHGHQDSEGRSTA